MNQSAGRAFGKWFAIGVVFAISLVWTQALAVGGLEGLLQVGEHSRLRPYVESRLGEVPLAEGTGHDGQIFFAMATDLDGSEIAPLLDHAGYRYRRILYPAVASLGGLLGGQSAIWGLAAAGVVAFGLAAGALASLSVRAGRAEWWALAVVLNPGVWLSVRLLTSDVLALALMLAALRYAGRRLSLALFALSGLAKEVYLATPLALGARWRRWQAVLVPTAIVAAWILTAELLVDGVLAPRGNFAWPLMGIVEASENWGDLPASELLYLGFALGSVALGLAYSRWSSGTLRFPVAAWALLGLVSSSWVWDFGNNAARVFAPIVVLACAGMVGTGREAERDEAVRPAAVTR